jgi:hypothetical protein
MCYEIIWDCAFLIFTSSAVVLTSGHLISFYSIYSAEGLGFLNSSFPHLNVTYVCCIKSNSFFHEISRFDVTGFLNDIEAFWGIKLSILSSKLCLGFFEFSDHLLCSSSSGFLSFRNCMITQMELATNKLQVHYPTWILRNFMLEQI